MDGKGEAPSIYETEGASRPRGFSGPIDRPAIPRNTPSSLGEPRLAPVDSVPASWEGAFLGRLASLVDLSRTPSPDARSRELLVWCSLALRFPSELASPSLVAWEISISHRSRAQEVEGSLFKILYDGLNHPQLWLSYPQSKAPCPPVVHYFIHTRTSRGNATEVMARYMNEVSGG
jgi:hypothetical protein